MGFDRNFQTTLTGIAAIPTETFKRPEFAEKDFPQTKGSNKKPFKDSNWFYVDFYGQDDKFEEAKNILKRMKVLKADHRLDSNQFLRMAKKFAGEDF